ncbi:MAG TPA: hypothetical protein DDZ51_26635 [Planctomycetaceae bacterium]|nr:hypothetical protein [Planctomycetaceae bacterium]
MSTPRPQISPLLLAEMIESMPGRVRKRLDAEPDVAQGWAWTFEEDRWLIAAGDERVELRGDNGVIVSHEHLRCSCLLTPKCFHVVACISVLSTVSANASEETIDAPGDASVDAPVDEPVEPSIAAKDPQVDVTDEMRSAAKLAQSAVAAVLRVGASRAGLLVQSTVLRAAHQCRESGLIALGNTLLRIVEGGGRLRSNRESADASTLRDDLASALAMSLTVMKQPSAPKWLVGQARRTFDPIDVRKLEGVCAEPILTLSGYAGVCVYLQGGGMAGEDLFTVNELRPGDSQLVLQAYGGGIDLGTVAIEAKRLCRSSLAVQNLTASSDGRLGKGKTTRWAVQSERAGTARFCEGRFALPLEEQIEHVFQRSLMSDAQRHGGWYLIAFDAIVLGPRGASVLVAVDQASAPWRLRIAIDDVQLAYRENLSLLARCPGLAIRCIGRLRLDAAGEVDLIAIAAHHVGSDSSSLGNSSSSETNSTAEKTNDARPQIAFPPQWEGVCNVGLDRLQRQHFIGIQRWSDETNLGDDQSRHLLPSDGLDSLRRRLNGLAMGGRVAVPALGSSTHRREQRRLQQSYQTTAAQLLELLAISASHSSNRERIGGKRMVTDTLPIEESFLACSHYLKSSQIHFEKQIWLRFILST